ncbi:MAG: hypothetical protein KatS3mg042_1803 [Rhodothermaceae bacterium]|nr:MAG: hypothetical protein KatS3mg042_1803 [Rhodothermaceae bacterium]
MDRSDRYDGPPTRRTGAPGLRAVRRAGGRSDPGPCARPGQPHRGSYRLQRRLRPADDARAGRLRGVAAAAGPAHRPARAQLRRAAGYDTRRPAGPRLVVAALCRRRRGVAPGAGVHPVRLRGRPLRRRARRRRAELVGRHRGGPARGAGTPVRLRARGCRGGAALPAGRAPLHRRALRHHGPVCRPPGPGRARPVPGLPQPGLRGRAGAPRRTTSS